MAMTPKEVAREIAREEDDDMLRREFRHDRDNPIKPTPADVLDYTRRQMARSEVVKNWWGKILLAGLGAIGVGAVGSMGDILKWLLRKFSP